MYHPGDPMALHQSPMPSIVAHEAIPAVDIGSSSLSSRNDTGSTSGLSPRRLRPGHQQTLPLSPPFSPPRKTEELRVKSPSESAGRDNGHRHMLSVSSSASEAVKLDVSSLLKSDPSPPPSTSGADSKRGGHSRSSSVPLPVVQHFAVGNNHRISASESSVVVSTARHHEYPLLTTQTSYASHQPRTHYPSVQPPRLPSIQAPLPAPLGPHSHPQPPAGPHHLPQPQPQPQPPAPGSPYLPQHPTYASSSQRRLSPTNPPTKRPATGPHPAASPAKRQSKWTPEEDALIIELRGSGMKWEEISKRLPGRSAISCRLHYQNYLERRSEWDEERKNRLARLYERLKPEMWGPLAAELGIPWRAAEAMHWQLGEADMARRAGVVPFSLATSVAGVPGPPSAVSAPGPSPLSASPYGPNAPGVLQLPGVSRATSIARRPEEPLYPPQSALSTPTPAPRPVTGAPPVSGPALLPSLAELDRGRSAYDERARAGEAHPAWYPPPPPPPAGRGPPDYRR